MKPIFNKEKNFLEKRLGFSLPSECWRKGQAIYLNTDKKTKILSFKVEHKKIIVTFNKIDSVLKKYKNKTWQEEIEENSERLDALFNESLKNTIECMKKYPNHNWRISDSTGKDSALTMFIFKMALQELKKEEKKDKGHLFDLDFFNTTNDTADTYRTLKENVKNAILFILKEQGVSEKELAKVDSIITNFDFFPSSNDNADILSEVDNNSCREDVLFVLDGVDITERKLKQLFYEYYQRWVHNPEVGWHDWVEKEKEYYLPSVMVRNCCSTYKEGKQKEILDKNTDYVLFLGMRKYESVKRSDYDWYLNDAMDIMYEKTQENKYKLNVPRNWVRFLPIVEWRDEDVWLFILREKIQLNPMYEMGFSRVGCLLCPYSSDYNDLLIEHYYPYQWNRWANIVEKNYDLFDVENRLKWTKEEYIQEGKWKDSMSKVYHLIKGKPTKEKITKVSELLDISEELAEKYFKRKCSCGKTLNPDEVAMFLKIYGRYENEVDERVYLCKKCLCEQLGIDKKTYAQKVREYRDGGCNLF